MVSPVPHPGLLDLPRELRDQIYRYLIYFHAEPPKDPSCAIHGQRVSDPIRRPWHFYVWRHCALAWTNRQLRNEYNEVVEERWTIGRITAELDVMAKGYIFWPTWTMLPTFFEPGRGPFDLDVSLRIFSTESFRSNDGWPRQPGDGFRTLKKMLDLFTHDGPSFGYVSKYTDRNELWTVNRLSVNVTFHEQSKPDSWPETTHNIFKMLKALAVDGLAGDILKRVRVHAEYMHEGQVQVFDREWEVSDQYDATKAEQWRSIGFLSPMQKTLSDME